MTDRRTPVHRSGLRRARDAALGGVSLLALMLAGAPGEARSLSSSAASIPLTTLAQQAATAAAQQAAAAGAQAQASMARAAAAIAAMRKLQLDAAAAAQAALSSVPNGLTTGGLMPAGGTNSDPTAGINADPTKWRGAANPVQTSNGSGVQVDITQNQQKAILYWDTFNVGAKTTVNFNQSASDWIALNRVLDPSLAPSQILGQIHAPGSVYIINRNGIIFGAGSQVNVHSLGASTLDVGQLGTELSKRDDYFLNIGIGNPNAFSVYDPAGGVATALIPGDVTVQRGASITANIATDISQLGSPGFVYLFGANVANSGLITAPTGQVGMVAARAIDLVPKGYSVLPSAVLGKDSNGNNNKFRGTEFRIERFDTSYDSTTGQAKGTGRYLANTGVVTHDGLIDVSRGIVVMNGDTVTIGNPKDANVQGVISVDTSIGRNAMVLLRAATSVSMNGVISSLPYDDGTTRQHGAELYAGLHRDDRPEQRHDRIERARLGAVGVGGASYDEPRGGKRSRHRAGTGLVRPG
jgi:filamentous hemagglutinin family protein